MEFFLMNVKPMDDTESCFLQSAFCIGLIMAVSIGLDIYFVGFNARVDELRESVRTCEGSCTIRVLKRWSSCSRTEEDYPQPP